MIPSLVLILLTPVLPLAAQQVDQVRQGTLEVTARVAGTVIAEDSLRLKSPIDGRAEEVWPSTGVWVSPKQILGFLLTKETAALLDGGSSLNQLKENPSKSAFEPVPIACPQDCLLIKSFIRPKQWVKSSALLFEAAAGLRLEAQVSTQAQLVRDGMLLQYWDLSHPEKTFTRRVVHYRLQFPEGQAAPVGVFSLKLDEKEFLMPGTPWEGRILISKKNRTLRVPTRALLHHGQETYLPVLVSTGMTTPEWTEITSGAQAQSRILILGNETTPPPQEPSFETVHPAAPPPPAPTAAVPPVQDRPAPVRVAAPSQGAQIDVIHEHKAKQEAAEDPYAE